MAGNASEPAAMVPATKRRRVIARRPITICDMITPSLRVDGHAGAAAVENASRSRLSKLQPCTNLHNGTHPVFLAEETPTTALEDQLNGHFWLRECNQYSPLCAGYVAGFTRMNSTLAHPFFCPGDMRVADVEIVIAKELRRLNRLSPALLDYPMPALMMNALERWFPCNTMVGQARGTSTSPAEARSAGTKAILDRGRGRTMKEPSM